MRQKDFCKLTPEEFREELGIVLEDKRHKDKARDIERILDDMSLDEAKLAMIMAHEMNRATQQTFTRLCTAWLRLCGSPHYRTDGRNDDSAKVGIVFNKSVGDHYLPYI